MLWPVWRFFCVQTALLISHLSNFLFGLCERTRQMTKTANSLEIAANTARIIGPLLGVPQEMSYAEATKKLFHGKPKRWVTLNILERFPEVYQGPHAWISQPKGSGYPIKIKDAVGASIWLLQHNDEID